MAETDRGRFLADLEAKPAALRALAEALDGEVWAAVGREVSGVLLMGMGSSWFAADTAARVLRALGVRAVAERSSAEAFPPVDRDTVVVAVSASGSSRETVAAAATFAGRAPVVALCAVAPSPLTSVAGASVAMRSGVEAGGVSCRSFQHTVLLLQALAERFGARPAGTAARSARRAADATEDLLGRRDAWLPELLSVLDGGAGVWAVAPAERLCSAEQSALMVREGPRRVADACETGDWSHVDVYLTRTLAYRALLLTGSRFDADVLRWCSERGAPVCAVGVGADPSRTGVTMALRYPGDDDADVARATETLVAELVAASWEWP